MKPWTLEQENAYLRRMMLWIAKNRAVARPLANCALRRLEKQDALRKIDNGSKLPTRKTPT